MSRIAERDAGECQHYGQLRDNDPATSAPEKRAKLHHIHKKKRDTRAEAEPQHSRITPVG